MTLAFWFACMRRSRRRLTQTGVRRNRWRAVHRRASFDALEGRALLSTVSFGTGSESVNEGAGTFSIPVTVTGTPTVAPATSAFASGLNTPTGLAFDAGNFFVANSGNGTVSEVSPAGVVSASPFATGLNDPVGLAFDSSGNLYVTNLGNDTVSEVTPAGVPSTFASEFNQPEGLTVNAGNLFVANADDNTISEVSQTVTVPFTLGGSAVTGVAFNGATASPLTFGIGQTTQDITGTLLSDPGPSQALTLTLGTPTGGAVLGSPSVNTLFIVEPTERGATTPQPTPTPTASPVLPVFLGEQRGFSHKGKHKKPVGFEFLFNGALDAAAAQATGHYRVTQKQGKRVKVLRVESALYDPGNFSVTLSVGGFKTGKAAQVTITGLAGVDGEAIPPITTDF
jgi:hypothetical protein